MTQCFSTNSVARGGLALAQCTSSIVPCGREAFFFCVFVKAWEAKEAGRSELRPACGYWVVVLVLGQIGRDAASGLSSTGSWTEVIC